MAPVALVAPLAALVPQVPVRLGPAQVLVLVQRLVLAGAQAPGAAGAADDSSDAP